MALDDYLGAHRAAVNAHLERSRPPFHANPPHIREAIRYATLAGGKRLRPILVRATAELVGASPDDVLDAAAAIELIHIATLLLDDLPSMDDARLRHGQPTTHTVYGEAVAILASVALLVHAFELAVANGERLGLGGSELSALVRTMARATGAVGLVGGQFRDLMAVSGELDVRTLEYIHSRKTGQLFVLAATIAPLLNRAPGADITALERYAKNLGLAYQIVDDLLDREGSVDELGKDVGQDRGRTTFASLVSAEGARRLVSELVTTSIGWLTPYGARARWLEELAHALARRTA